MSAAGRLWRRAPAWRSCLVLAMLATGVAALYAPWSAPAQGRPGSQANSRYIALTRAGLLGAVRTGTVIVANRQVPLPAGEWHLIVTETQRVDPQVHSGILVQVAGDRIVGLVVARGTAVPSDAARKLPFGQACESTRAFQARIVPTTDGARECWGLTPEYFPAAWRSRQTDLLYVRALDALAQAGLQLPPAMVMATWFRADPMNWAAVEYFFDPTMGANPSGAGDDWTRQSVAASPEKARFVQQVAQWSESWTPLLEKGAAGRLAEGEVAAALSAGASGAQQAGGNPPQQVRLAMPQDVPGANPYKGRLLP